VLDAEAAGESVGTIIEIELVRMLDALTAGAEEPRAAVEVAEVTSAGVVVDVVPDETAAESSVE
jgi:hypothetical protein